MSKKATPLFALDHNYAKDKEFGATLTANLMQIWESCKTNRKGRELVWQASYRQWSVDKTESDQSYKGMADLKVPQLRKEVETMSRRLFKGLLPDDYLSGEAESGFHDSELSTVNTQVVRHYYDNVMQIKRQLYPWIKQKVLFGTSPIRQYWHRAENEMFFKKRVAYEDKFGAIKFKAENVKENVLLYNAPKLRAEDIFNTWVYPHNAQQQEDIEIVFWRTVVKKSDLEHKAANNMCAHIGELDNGKASIDDFQESQERLAQFSETGVYQSLQGNDFYELLEVWCPLLLPGSDKLVSCVVEIIDGKLCTRAQRNPYWHQQTPFDFGRFIIPPPGEFYGRGLPEAGMSLALQLDDTMNQTMDATTLALNNITIINPAYAPNAESFEIEPNAVWWADPNAVKQFVFPDLTDSGYKAAGTLRNWISEMSDNQPQLPDPIAGKARSTGQAQMAVGEWQTDLFCFIDFLSVEALSSMAHKTHSLLQQFLGEDDIIRVSGKYADTWTQRVVTPEDLCGRYKFKWMGSLQIESQSIKTQQMLNLLQIWKNLPQDAQAQVKMRWQNFMVKLMRDGFLIKDVDNIVETDHMVATTSPELEEKILKAGGDINVEKADNDSVHNSVHEREHALDKDVLSRAKRSKHIEMHRAQAQQKLAEEKQIAMQMAALQAGGIGPNGAPQGGGGQAGNPTQIPEGTTQANLNRTQQVGTGSN